MSTADIQPVNTQCSNTAVAELPVRRALVASDIDGHRVLIRNSHRTGLYTGIWPLIPRNLGFLNNNVNC